MFAKILSVLIATCVFFAVCIANPGERLWVSFTGESAKYLISIDSAGNVLLPPHRVNELGNYHFTRQTSLSLNGSRFLNYWFVVGIKGQVFRIVLDKNTLRSVKLIKTNLKGALNQIGEPSTLDVTNRDVHNFISFPIATSQAEGIRVVAYPINDSGLVIGREQFLTTTLSANCGVSPLRCKGGISANRQFVYWIDRPRPGRSDLFIQRLSSGGQVVDRPKLIDSFVSRAHFLNLIIAADISSTLNDGRTKYVVYVTQREVHRASLMLQKIDAFSGDRIGKANTLLKAILFRDVKIDPSGRFVLFIVDDPRVGSGVAFLSLDLLGNSSGNPKMLTSPSFVAGLDLLRERT